MRPLSTYRFQFNSEFQFQDAKALVPYLHEMGISHLYASPIFRARTGSPHGYDITDPTRLNPELGTEEDFNALAAELEKHRMGLFLDIVPNHMAVGEENPWWQDVLQKGQRSDYARFFDIDWASGGGKLILPDLGEPGPDRVEKHCIRTYWKTGTERINYRRFFDITHLIGVRVEDPEVFDATHALILRLVGEGKVHGLRVDHIDGLRDPAAYLERLRSRVGKETHILVEKILFGREKLPRWPVDGTTGYVFLNTLNGIFVEERGLRELRRRFGGPAFDDLVYDKKKLVLRKLFAGELRRFAGGRFEKALVEVTACLPVYRTYIRNFRITPGDRRILEKAFRDAGRRSNVDLSALRRILFLEERRPEHFELVLRWQQLSGPAMAKGVEDTVFYLYNPLISLNEVGGECRGASVGIFHRTNLVRGGSLNATSNHDTKRSEDVRARINVLAEMPVEWGRFVKRWIGSAPDRALGWLFYQTLAGAWPLRDEEIPGFRERMRAYMLKAAREGKVHTSWRDPNPEFEATLMQFVDSMVDKRFLAEFLPLERRVAFYGAINSLSQVVVKVASPGIPGLYQGNEVWELSLVDPDNRRPVDFELRRRMIRTLDRSSSSELLAQWEDGRIKMFVTRAALRFRREKSGLFLRGTYVPLRATGKGRRHVVAFARRKEREYVIAAVPRLVTKIVPPGTFPLRGDVWGTARLVLPASAPSAWRNVFTGEEVKSPLYLAEVFHSLPVAMLQSGSS